MAQQSDLTWNGLTLCDVSDGGGYRVIERGPAKRDEVEASIPNTSGRRLRTVGVSLSESTTFRVKFEVSAHFTSVSSAESFQNSIETKMRSATSPLGTLSYSYPGNASAYTKTNMSLDDYQFGEYWGDGASKHVIMFSVTFSKWGA